MFWSWIAVAVLASLVEGEELKHRTLPRTLDRKAAELTWKNWLQSSESRDPSAPPRRITTKSLFLTPTICAHGQRLDKDGCVQVVNVNQEDHDRYLLETLSELFKEVDNTQYDYEDEPAGSESGPLQLTIPIGLELPVAAALLPANPLSQEQQVNYVKVDKKNEPAKIDDNNDMQLVAELEILKLESLEHKAEKNQTDGIFQDAENLIHNTTSSVNVENSTNIEGQKEIIFGQIPVDSMTIVTSQKLLQAENVDATDSSTTLDVSEATTTDSSMTESTTFVSDYDSTTNLQDSTNSDVFSTTTFKSVTIKVTHNQEKDAMKTTVNPTATSDPVTESSKIINDNSFKTDGGDKISTIDNKYLASTTEKSHVLRESTDKSVMHPEIDYSDLSETIKIISRYAEVTTDEDFKNNKRFINKDDSPLGTRTRSKHKPKPILVAPVYIRGNENAYTKLPRMPIVQSKPPPQVTYKKHDDSYLLHRWMSKKNGVPPSDYPFHNVQDYWQGENPSGGVYRNGNPRRHHHSYQNGQRHAKMEPAEQSVDPRTTEFPELPLRHWIAGRNAAKR